MQNYEPFYNLKILGQDNDLVTDYHLKKKWNEMGKLLESFLKNVNTNEANMGKLNEYLTKIIKDYAINIDPMIIAEILYFLSSNHERMEERINFMDANYDRIKNHSQAKYLLTLYKGYIYLQFEKYEKVKEVLDEIKLSFRKLKSISRNLYCNFYDLLGDYYYSVKDLNKYYETKLKYLGFLNLKETKKENLINTITKMAISCLVSESIYNFGELLEIEAFKILYGTDKQILINLMEIFNEANYIEYNKLFETNNLNNFPILLENKNVLDLKLKIMILLETLFNSQRKNNFLTFEEISKLCFISIQDVDFILVKCFSNDLFKGKIDDIKQIVYIESIKPRILDKSRIYTLKEKFLKWEKNIKNLNESLDNKFN